jgi:hypothetical protein
MEFSTGFGPSGINLSRYQFKVTGAGLDFRGGCVDATTQPYQTFLLISLLSAGWPVSPKFPLTVTKSFRCNSPLGLIRGLD